MLRQHPLPSRPTVAGQSRARRAVGPFEDRDKGVERDVSLVVERCFFEGCLPPPVPTVPTGRPDTVQLWSQATEDKWAVPGEMEDVTIPAGEQRTGREALGGRSLEGSFRSDQLY